MKIIFKNTDLIVAKNINLFNGRLIHAFNSDYLTKGYNLMSLIGEGSNGGYYDIANAISNDKVVYLYKEQAGAFIPLNEDPNAKVLYTNDATDILDVQYPSNSNVIPTSSVEGVTKRFICYGFYVGTGLSGNIVISQKEL